MSAAFENNPSQIPQEPAVASFAGIGAPAPLLPSESLAEFEAFHQPMKQERQPHSVTEQVMVYQITCTFWRLRRIPRLESVCLAGFSRPGHARQLDQLSRYESRLLHNHEQLERRLSVAQAMSRPGRQPAPQPGAGAPAAAPPQPGLSFHAALNALTRLSAAPPPPALDEAPRTTFIGVPAAAPSSP